MSGLTYEQLLTTVVVALLLIGAYKTIMDAMKTHREEVKRKNQPTADLSERVTNHDTLLASDNRRITKIEEDMTDVREGQKVLVIGVQALIDHALHNGNAEQLKSSSDGISSWLTNRL